MRASFTFELLPVALVQAGGFRIFPLTPNGKTPAIKDWPNRATTDSKQIEAWWEENPDYNIGVATGAGLTVLDFDCKDGKLGLDSLARMYAKGLPRFTPRVITPTGGVHIYLRSPPALGIRSSVNALPGFPDVDVRGEGGYVVGHGSTIDGRPYKAARGPESEEWEVAINLAV